MSLAIFVSFTIFGVLISLYLSYHYGRGTNPSFLILNKKGFERIHSGKYSNTYGIPNPYVILGILLSTLIFTVLFHNGQITFLPVKVHVAIGLMFALYLVSMQALVLRAVCLWYVISAITFFLLFLFSDKI